MNTTPYKPLNELLFDVYIVLYHADTELRCDRLIFNELQKKKKNTKKKEFYNSSYFSNSCTCMKISSSNIRTTSS